MSTRSNRHTRSLTPAPTFRVAVFNGKGGSRKTSLVLGLAATAARLMSNVTVVDIDPQGSATAMTALMVATGNDPGYRVIPEPTDPAELALIPYATGLVFVDCPGSLVSVDTLDVVISGVDLIVIPFDNTALSGKPTIDTIEYIVNHGGGGMYMVLITGVSYPSQEDAARKDLMKARIPTLKAVVREYAAWSNTLAAGRPITMYPGEYGARAQADILAVLTEILSLHDNQRRMMPNGRQERTERAARSAGRKPGGSHRRSR